MYAGSFLTDFIFILELVLVDVLRLSWEEDWGFDCYTMRLEREEAFGRFLVDLSIDLFLLSCGDLFLFGDDCFWLVSRDDYAAPINLVWL